MTDIFAPYTHDTYTTAPNAATPLGRVLPSLRFFSMLFGLVWRDGWMAKKGPYAGSDWARASMDTLRYLEESGVQIIAEGMENITTCQEPCVFIANHMSTLETLVLPIFIQPRKDVTFITKESLANYPLFGHILKSRDPITVGRENPRKDLSAVLEGGTERLKAGRSIIVFPQSTRSHTFDPGLFNTIGVKLAKRAGAPIIPVALQTNAWGIGSVIKELGPINQNIPVRFAFGTKLTVSGTGKEEHAAICDFISQKLHTWQQAALSQ